MSEITNNNVKIEISKADLDVIVALLRDSASHQIDLIMRANFFGNSTSIDKYNEDLEKYEKVLEHLHNAL